MLTAVKPGRTRLGTHSSYAQLTHEYTQHLASSSINNDETLVKLESVRMSKIIAVEVSQQSTTLLAPACH